LLGPRDHYVTLAWSWAENLATLLPFTTAAVALYAAAGRRVLVMEVSEDGTPADRYPHRPTVAP
jgi:hypothetical protein